MFNIFAVIGWLVIPTSWYPYVVLALVVTLATLIASLLNEEGRVNRIPGSKI